MREVFLVALLIVPAIAEAAPRTYAQLANLVTNLINGGIGVALSLGIVIYFYGVAVSIPKTSEGDMQRLRAHFFWGIIALFVMFSVWGILGILRNTLFGGGGGGFGGGAGQVLCTSLEDCRIIRE